MLPSLQRDQDGERTFFAVLRCMAEGAGDHRAVDGAADAETVNLAFCEACGV